MEDAQGYAREHARVDPSRIYPLGYSGAAMNALHLAAQNPRVARIFVDAAIKRDLCARTWEERSWLRRARPVRSRSSPSGGDSARL